MKPIMFIGLILVVLGIEALSYIGVRYTSREEIDPIEVSADIHKTIPLLPVSEKTWMQADSDGSTGFPAS